VTLDSGAGLANATLQQRLVAVRLFYGFLIEEGLREANPVGRGRYTPDRGFGGGGSTRGLVPRLAKLPWIPTDQQWLDVLEMFAAEPARNRLMVALAYDAALRAVRNSARCVPIMWIRPTDAHDPGSRRRRPGPGGWCVFGGDRGATGWVSGAPWADQPRAWTVVLVGVSA
jgi:hypothetical protein